MKDHIRPVGSILIVWVFTTLLSLGDAHLWDVDEARNAGCALEMQGRNDWIVPTFNDELRTHKPVLLYWAIRVCYAAFGVNEFAARFPSALAGLGTCIATYLIGVKLFSRSTGWLGSIALLTTLMFATASRASTPDSILIFFITAAIAVVFHGFDFKSVVPATFELSWGNAFVAYSFLGAAVLAKGPVGVVLPMATIGIFLLLQQPSLSHQLVNDSPVAGHIRVLKWFASKLNPIHVASMWWRLRPVTCAACVLLVALPWYTAVTITTDGVWVRNFLLEHNFGRAMAVRENHGGSIAYYPAALLIGSFPWSIFWIPTLLFAAKEIRREGPNHRSFQLLVCWIAVVVGCFTIAQTKLPSYITPCYPAWCLLTAELLRSWVLEQSPRQIRWAKLAFLTYSVIGLALIVAVPIIASRFVPGAEWVGFIGLICLVAGFASLRYSKNLKMQQALVIHAISATAFIACSFGTAATRVDRHRPTEALISAIEATTHDIAAFRVGVKPSWIFYARKPVHRFRNDELQKAAEFLRSSNTRLITGSENQVAEFERMGLKTRIVAEIPGFLNDDPVVVIERVQSTIALDARKDPERRYE